MKEKKQTVKEMVMQAHYLNALDIESRDEKRMSDSEISIYLGIIKEKDVLIESLRISLAEVNKSLKVISSSFDEQTKTLAKIQNDLELMTLRFNNMAKERDDLQARINLMNTEVYSSKSTSVKTRSSNQTNSREEDKDGWTSKNDNDKPSSGNAGVPSGLDMTKVKSESLDGKRGNRNFQKKMEAAITYNLKTSLKHAPKDMTFVGYKTVEEYTRKSYVECTRFEVAIYKDAEGVYHDYYEPEDTSDKRRPKADMIPGTHCTPEFLTYLIIDKFMLFIPFYREQVRHELEEFCMSENTNRNWLIKGSQLLSPIMKVLKSKLLNKNSILNIDETWTKVRIKYLGDGTKLGKYFKKYVWVLVNKKEKVTYFFYDNDENDSRGTRPIANFLGDFLGTIQSDGYVVYKHLVNDNPKNKHLMCWAHVRNRFEQTYRSCKDKDADWFVKQIGELYRIEAECIMSHYTPEQIKERRNKKDVTQILESLKSKSNKLLSETDKVQYGEMMKKALSYMNNNWDDLVKYREDGECTIDNMNAERAIRPFTVARKNSLHFSSEDGVDMAMTYHTIIETCKQIGLNIKYYLNHIFHRLMNGDKDYESMLPEAVLQTIK